MPRSINRIEVGGHLGRDPEVRHTQSGDPVTTLSIATSEGTGDRERTTWHKVVVFNGKNAKLAEWAAEAHKGDYVMVFGRLRDNQWEDNDGNRRVSKEVIAFEYQNFSRKAEKSAVTTPRPEPAATSTDFNDDIPF